MERMERLERSRRMERLEVTCRTFAVLSGTRQEADDYTTCVQPKPGSRKGTLVLLTEPAGDHPSLSIEACKLAQKIITEHYVGDNSLSLTSGFQGALDAANSAVLRFNYASPQDSPDVEQGSPVPVQTGGSRAGRFKVGLTAVMLRSDGTGLYMAQMAPAQAYIRHNGMVTAVPETPGWSEQGRSTTKHRPPLSLVRGEDAEEQELFTEAAELEDAPTDYSQDMQENLLTPALGTAPGLESDLTYRRVEEGDLVVLVSSGLARLLDRDTAEEIITTGDADAVSEALYELAMNSGVAQAHACVLTLGSAVSFAPEPEWGQPPAIAVVPPASEEYESGHDYTINDSPAHGEAGPRRLAGLRGTLLAPRAWFDNKRQQVSSYAPEELTEANAGDEPQTESSAPWTPEPLQIHQHVHVQVHQDATTIVERESADAEPATEAPATWEAQHMMESAAPAVEFQPMSAQPGAPVHTLLQRTVYVPTHKAPVLWDQDDEAENAPFEGWEDKPAVLTYPDDGSSEEEENGPTVFPWEKEPLSLRFQTTSRAATQDAGARKNYPAPQLFAHNATPFEQPAPTPTPTPALTRTYHGAAIAKRAPGELVRLGRNAAAWVGSTAHNMLPERQLFKPKRVLNTWKGSTGGRTVPVRVLTAVALLVVLGLLAWSVLRVMGNNKQTVVNTLLQQAKQEDLLANQPATSDSDRSKALLSALLHAKQAVASDPQSGEAKLLVGKVQSELDKVQGITRLTGVNALFDLSQMGITPSISQTGKPAVAAPATGVTQSSNIVVMSNDAYVLDRSKGKIYRCNISAKSCRPALSAGDTAAGQKVGQPVAMTVRVGNLVAVDDKLSVYTYSPDTSAWQAEQLGSADKLQKPLDVATYDGNLYLLEGTSGHISKYAAGKYGSAPDDWIKEPASADQVKNPVSMAIDGSIYVLLSDGKILVMQGGKVARTITPKASASDAAPSDVFTSTDTRDLYVLRATDGAITRISKEGQTLGTFKAPTSDEKLATLSGMTVDEGRGKLYLVSGQKVYEANLPGQNTQPTTDAPPASPQQAAGVSQQPTVRPTAEP